MSLRTVLLLLGVAAATLARAQVSPNPKRGVQPSSPISEVGTALWRGMQVHYVMKNGLPIYQGDIILDNLTVGADLDGASSEDLGNAARLARGPRLSPRSLGIIYPSTLWPAKGGIYQIPYIITNGTANLNTAIAKYNTTFAGVIQWVPRTTEADYVNFNLDPSNQTSSGNSDIGRTGGEQVLNCGINCTVGGLAHEMGHATGLWHEQTRTDRDSYVNLDYRHIRADSLGADAVATDNAWIYGPYDYGSVMDYSTFTFTADGSPTMQSVPAGIPLSNYDYYTTGDMDTIRRLYSAVPTSITVDTNPTGLQLIVDGSTITTPQTYANWALNSTHTLVIPGGLSNSGLQSQGGFDYQFGRWNDGGAANHTISVIPGNGQAGYPQTSPAQTVYTANFIQWAPFSPSPDGSYPAGGGTLATTPAPTAFTGVGQFFLASQNVALNAHASPGYNFIRWYFSDLDCGSTCYPSSYANPLDLYYWIAQDPEPAFTKSQVTTITTNPAGLPVQVDGTTYTSAQSFSPDPSVNGSAWASGTSHTVSVPSPQNPWSPNTSYVWSNWSDGQAQTHQIIAGSGNSTITANYTTQVGLVLGTNSNNSCAGSVAATPPGPFTAGSSVTFTATPSSGFVFTQWEGALSGSANPSTGPVNQEEFVQADFNTISSPLTITSVSPPVGTAGSAPFTLTVNGTGFVPSPAGSAYVWYNDVYQRRLLTYISPTQIQIPILAADVASPGAIRVLVYSSVNNCAILASTQLAVSPAGPPSITPAGIVPLYSTVNTIQPGEWVSIYGTNLASSALTWKDDFPTSLGSTSVTINGKPAYLWFISPGQINLQAPGDTATGSVPVVVTTASGTSTSTVTLAPFAPSFLLLDSKHVTGIIVRSNGSGAYGGGTYDIIGPTGNSLGYPTVAAKAGDTLELFAVGLGPTDPAVSAGQAFSGAAPTTNSVNLLINNVGVTPAFAGLSGTGLYQINLTVPADLAAGDVSLVATVGGAQTPPNTVISLQ